LVLMFIKINYFINIVNVLDMFCTKILMMKNDLYLKYKYYV